MATSIEQNQRGIAPAQSFAFSAPDPYQGRSAETGATGQHGLVGGQVVSRDGDPSVGVAGPVIGAFLDDLLKPLAKQRATEQFLEGYTNQMARDAGAEIAEGGLGTRLFGSYAQDGAAAFASQERVAAVQNDWNRDLPELMLLDPSQLSKELSARMTKAMTGIGVADEIIGPAVMQAAPSMIHAAVKAREAHTQAEAYKRGESSLTAAAEAYNTTSEIFFKDAKGEDQLGWQTATRNFVAQVATRPEGMLPERHEKLVAATVIGMAQRGQGFAVRALQANGVLDNLTEEVQTKVRTAIDTSARKAVATASVSNPRLRKLLNDYAYDESYNTFGNVENMQARQAEINAEIKRATGFDFDYYSPDDVNRATSNYYKEQARLAEKAEDRAEAERLRQLARQEKEEEDRRKAELKDANILSALASENPAVMAQRLGLTKDDLEPGLGIAFDKGDWQTLNRTLLSGLGVSGRIKSMIDQTVTSVAETGDGTAFVPLVGKMDGMMQANPALAKAYFGDHYPTLLHFRSLMKVQGMSPQAALGIAMAPTSYFTDSKETAAAGKATIKWVDANAAGGSMLPSPTWFKGDWLPSIRDLPSRSLNESSKLVVAGLLAKRVAVAKKSAAGAIPDDKLTEAEYKAAVHSGEIEHHGPIAWTQRQGVPTMAQVTGLPPDAVSASVLNTIDSRLKARGFTEGARGDTYQIFRANTPAGDSLTVVPDTDWTKAVIIPMSVFKADATAMATATRKPAVEAAARTASAEAAVRAGRDPYRREASDTSGAARIARINRETELIQQHPEWLPANVRNSGYRPATGQALKYTFNK